MDNLSANCLTSFGVPNFPPVRTTTGLVRPPAFDVRAQEPALRYRSGLGVAPATQQSEVAGISVHPCIAFAQKVGHR